MDILKLRKEMEDKFFKRKKKAEPHSKMLVSLSVVSFFLFIVSLTTALLLRI